MSYLSLSCTGLLNSFFFFFLSFSCSSSSSSSDSEPSSLSSLSDADLLSSLGLALSERLAESDSVEEKGERVSRSVHFKIENRDIKVC